MRYIVLLVFLAGCAPTTIEGAVSKIKEAQAAGERRVDALVDGVKSFTCDLDVKRLEHIARTDPPFLTYFFSRCGSQYPGVINAAIVYRNANPVPTADIPGE